MRLDKVYIDGFKNLKQLAVDFDESKLTTVLIGQNGAGKSNLIEAITQVFRWVDLRELCGLRFPDANQEVVSLLWDRDQKRSEAQGWA